MSTGFDDVNAKCPFFLTSDERNIKCEGIVRGCITTLTFVSVKKRNLHRTKFCDAKFNCCTLHKMLEEKYEK